MSNWNELDPSFPDEELSLFGPGTDSGTFDYFTDEINGEEGASRSDYTASEDDNDRHRRRRREGRPRLLRLLVLRGEPGHAEGARDRRRRRLRRAERRGGAGRHVQAALASALHLREERSRWQRPEVEAFMHYILDNETEIAEASQFVPLTDEQLTKAQADLEGALGSSWLDRDRPPERSHGSAPGAGATARTSSRASSPSARSSRSRRRSGSSSRSSSPAFEFFQEVSIRRLPDGQATGRRSSSPPTSASCR